LILSGNKKISWVLLLLKKKPIGVKDKKISGLRMVMSIQNIFTPQHPQGRKIILLHL